MTRGGPQGSNRATESAGNQVTHIRSWCEKKGQTAGDARLLRESQRGAEFEGSQAVED